MNGLAALWLAAVGAAQGVGELAVGSAMFENMREQAEHYLTLHTVRENRRRIDPSKRRQFAE